MDRLMKDSGVEWIGKIPEKWEMRKLKHILRERNEKNDPIITRDILSLTAAQGVIPYSEKEGGGNKPKDDFSAYKIARPNDVVMNSMNILSGSVGLSKYFGCVSPVYYMLYSDSEDVNIEFYNYIFQTSIFQKSLRGLGNGIMMKETEDGKLNTIRMRIPMEKLGGLLLPLPDGETQNRIVNYLNAIVPEIDKVIETTKATIEDYKKYKQSVITEAVTKGLNPDVEMKDSGIEWIGEIPKNWTTKKIKNIGEYRNGLTYSPADMVDENEGILVLRSSNVQNGKIVYDDNVYVNMSIRPELKIKKGDILICSRNGSRELIGKNAVIEDEIEASFGAFMMIFRCDCPKYMYYVLNSSVFKYYLGSFFTATINQLTGTNFGNMRIVFCDNTKEQDEIVAFLDKKCEEIDNLISAKEQLIADMENYKKSLIYEYVTGKKEVLDNE